MYSDALLVKIVREPDPIPSIVDYLIKNLDPLVNLNDISASYGSIEETLQLFEEWLHDSWGLGFYRNLASTEYGWALPKALNKAAEINANVLVCDGLSLRELLVLRKRIKTPIFFTVERAPVPTTTTNVSQSVFGTPNLKDAFNGETNFEGHSWHSEVIGKITDPPRIGNSKNRLLLTQYPDAPLSGARSHRTTQVQDVSEVINQLMDLIENLSAKSPLIVTGDHGYIYLGSNPARYLWGSTYRKQERFGGEYGDNCLEVNGIKVAVGRIHVNVNPGTNTFIAHGGVSLTESLVPVITIGAGASL